MADKEFMVTISGPVLSLLYYESIRSTGDQMGFLLGETLEFVVKKHTDTANHVKTVRRFRNVQAILTWSSADSLYNSVGKVNREVLEKFLDNKSAQVIGWFHYKRYDVLIPTLRDRILHKEFASYFSNANGSKEESFVTCLLCSLTSSEGGTHKFKHVFLIGQRLINSVPSWINNLGINAFIHIGSEYMLTPTKTPPSIPDVFSMLIKSWNLDLTKMSSAECASTIQRAAEEHLNRLIPKLLQSDLEVAELENELTKLRLKQKMKMEKSMTNEEEQKSEEMSLSSTDISAALSQQFAESIDSEDCETLDSN